MSLESKPTVSRLDSRPLVPVALGTALVLVTYVTPMISVPATAADLEAGTAARAWILSSMSVGLAGALLASGVLGDAFGRRRVYAAGLVALAVGAALSAAAQEPVLFVVARVIEGIGGAAVLACGLSLLAVAYPPGRQRLHATSVWGASVALGIASGSILAAALDLGTGWREAYVVSAVLALVLLVPSLRGMAESRAEAPRRIDVPGLVLLVLAMALLVSALTQARNGVDPLTLVLAVLGLAALVAFAAVERRVAQPLLEPALLRHRGFLAATGGSMVLGLGMIGMSSFVPAVAQLGLGRGTWTGSLLVVVWAGVSLVSSLSLRHLPLRVEGPRGVASVLVLVAAGQLLGYGLTESSGWWRLAVSMAVSGIGTGVLNAVLGRDAVASVPPDRSAMGSGANNTARYLGAACGITLFVIVATNVGDSVLDGWNVAVLVASGLTLLGAALIALLGGANR